MPTKKKISRKKQVLILRNNRDLLLAHIFPTTCRTPEDTGKLLFLLARLRDTFGAPEAVWETMTTNRYEKKFPIINRIIAESFTFDDAMAFFGLFGELPERTIEEETEDAEAIP